MLTRSPLAMVLTQVRFPKEVTVLGQYDELDRAMRKAGFPLADTKVDNIASIGPDGSVQNVSQMERRVYDDAAESFTVSVGKTFLSLYCVDKGAGIPYEGHVPFLDKLYQVTQALEPLTGGVPIARLGYRYVDSLAIDDALTALSESCLGFGKMTQDASFPFGVSTSMVDAQLSFDRGAEVFDADVSQGGLHLACGTLAAGSQLDPAVPVCNEPRWIVDIDSYSQERFSFSADEIRRRAKALADQARRLFYEHVVTEEFKQQYQ